MALQRPRCQSLSALTILNLLLILTPSLAISIPIPSCAPEQSLSLANPAYNVALPATPSANLIPMTGKPGDLSAHMPFHMTRSSLGFIFQNYDHHDPVSNHLIMQMLQQAIRFTAAAFVRDPSLTERPIREPYIKWTHPLSKMALYIEPIAPEITYGNLFAVYYLLRTWAQEYQAEECDFEIWGFPGMRQEMRLGMGYFSNDPDPPLKQGKKGRIATA
ncbi:MAG: hypothetical protein LQ349_005593 [Xanthoria aureola]|nr:MAG: hypothetical protein LQ349_005593 [Xanthoria aureola]